MAQGDFAEVSTQNFSRGLVTVKPDHLLEEGESPAVSNVDFSRSVGRITKRRGYSLLQNANLGSGHPVKGLHEYIKASGTGILYSVVDKVIYEMTPASTWTARFTNSGFSVTQIEELVTTTHIRVTTSSAHGFSVAQVIYFFGGTNATAGQVPLLIAGSSHAVTNVVSSTVFDVVYANAGVTTYIANCGSVTASAAATNNNNLGHSNFATFNNLCIFVSLQTSTMKSTGSTFSPLLGTPPANALYIKSHRNRLWIANSSAGNSRVNYSALSNPEDWTTSGDAGFIDIGKDDGEQITGLASVGPNLVVFKQNSTWIIKNGTPTTFVVQRLSATIGCVAPRSVVECESFALYLSNNGVYAVNQNGVALMSYNIQPDFDSMSNATKALASAGRLRSQYWLSVDTDADSINDTAIVLDYVYGAWGKYSNKKESVYYTRQDGTLISGGADTDVVRKQDDTENDNGSAITMTYDSPGYEYGDWVRRKQVHDFIIKTNAVAGKTLVLSHLVDGVLQSSTKTFNLDAVIVGNDEVIHKFYHPPDTTYGLNIRLRLVNSETSAPVQVFGFSTRARMRERENG